MKHLSQAGLLMFMKSMKCAISCGAEVLKSNTTFCRLSSLSTQAVYHK